MKLVLKNPEILAIVLLTNIVSAKDLEKSRHRFVGGCREEVAGLFRTEEGGCKQVPEQLVWAAPFAKSLTHTEAQRECENLDNGWNDWRLPWPQELEKIAGSELAPRMIKRLGFGYFWTKEDSNSREALGLDPNLEDDNESMLSKDETARAICVREGFIAKPGEGCAENNVNFWTSTGGCRDLNSKLTWSKVRDKTVNDRYMNYEVGVVILHKIEELCSNYNQGGYNDWRTPTFREFETLAKNFNGLDLGVDPDVSFYSSTVEAKTSNNVLGIVTTYNIFTGNVSNTRNRSVPKSICVRGNL